MIKKLPFSIAFLLLIPLSPLSQAQSAYVVPTTEFGHPDIGGNWHVRFVTNLERPDNVNDLVLYCLNIYVITHLWSSLLKNRNSIVAALPQHPAALFSLCKFWR